MSRVRYLPRVIMKLLYHTLIYPYFTYCNVVWGLAKISILNKLVVLQKRPVRLCTGSAFRSSSRTFIY